MTDVAFVAYCLCGFIAILWIGSRHVLHKLKLLGASIDALESKTYNQSILVQNIYDRVTVLEARAAELDARTAEVKKSKDYIDSGHIFGWDPVASKFAWVKRKEGGDMAGILEIKTDAFSEPGHD